MAVAVYGLVGEIGSLTSAIKKKLLAEAGASAWDEPNEEIVEELGDAIWYGTLLALVHNDPRPINILKSDIRLLKAEIGGDSERAQKIRAALDPTKKDLFLQAAEKFPRTESMRFSHYQELAFLTARTRERVLLEVCLAVLGQLGAELLRTRMPEIELTLNKNIADRPVNVILGEVAWHLAAVASLFRLSLDEVLAKNVEKVAFRADRSDRTPLHDESNLESERFPRVFEISFVTVSPKRLGDKILSRSRMFMDGRQLGDELTDNSREDDGYRFHDVFHLANVAHLGWSPVVRKLMGRKRKSLGDETDEVEDGARAQIVEELVLKAIHSEGVRLARDTARCGPETPMRTFADRKAITFRFLKSLQGFVEGLEVRKNAAWEWEDAIIEGADAYYQLRLHGQGTVRVDLNERKLTFSPDVWLSIRGLSVGLGNASVSSSAEIDTAHLTAEEQAACDGDASKLRRVLAAKCAILRSLGLGEPSSSQQLDIKLRGNDVSVHARSEVQKRMWAIGALSFQLAFSEDTTGGILCSALAVTSVA
ncbi:MAG: hypothetical protein NVV62_10640 [Terricaulis sp.]|nr:hypothetical protein [Terricaulis sp.]